MPDSVCGLVQIGFPAADKGSLQSMLCKNLKRLHVDHQLTNDVMLTVLIMI